MLRLLIILVLLGSAVISSVAKKISINDGWQFKMGDDTEWTAVNLPHTWNTDAYTEKDYRKGKGIYRRVLSLTPADAGRNFYLRFEGVSKSANIRINNKEAGHHEGGYTSFIIPATEYLSFTSPNVIEVEVDNDRADIPPFSGDFTFFGGIYRDVWLEDYPDSHFSLDHFAAPGIKVTPVLNNGKWVIDTDLSLINEGDRQEKLTIELKLYSPSGEQLKSVSKNIALKANSTQDLSLSFPDIQNPHLWSPHNPELYRVEALLLDSNRNIVDRLTTDTGLREFGFDDDGRFILNGKPLKLRGICRHQDMKPYGPALRDEVHRRDMLSAKDMGANFIRISHYPQDPAILEYADKLGLLVWEEIPVIDIVPDDPGYANNAETNLREMIAQHYNHPSVIMWGYMNEILLKARRENPSDSAFASVLRRTHDLIDRLEKVTRESDPSRLSTMAFHGSDEYITSGIASVNDVNGWNLYQGWYGGDLQGFENFLSKARHDNPSKPIIVSEYGAGSDKRIHSLSPEPFDFSIEYQQKYLEHYIPVIEDSAFVTGGAHWNLIDFGSALREESMPRINNKGLLYADRTPKDVYHFFKASWRDDIDHIHIASRDWQVRTVVSDSATVTMPVKVYANTPCVELTVNGEKFGKKNVENHTVIFYVPLHKGKNTLIAEGGNATDVYDIELNIVPETLAADTANGVELAVNVGSNCSYISPVTGLTWVEDRIYSPGKWGRTGGKNKRVTAEIKGTEDLPLFQAMAENVEGYRFDVPDGDYELELGFADPSGNSPALAYMLGHESVKNDAATRFAIVINGKTAAESFSPSELNGSKFASITKYIIPSADNSIDIKFIPITGTPFLNTIKLRKL
ncbi:MAG: DUF4982 domain-containing protein [Bacteroides sp.]|nr:DUF4982 domain-containing protein [Bacteroides sp.]